MESETKIHTRVKKTLTINLSKDDLDEIILDHIRNREQTRVNILVDGEPEICHLVNSYEEYEGTRVTFKTVEDSDE